VKVREGAKPPLSKSLPPLLAKERGIKGGPHEILISWGKIKGVKSPYLNSGSLKNQRFFRVKRG